MALIQDFVLYIGIYLNLWFTIVEVGWLVGSFVRWSVRRLTYISSMFSERVVRIL